MTSATGRRPRSRCFTLLEVLVAVTVLGLITTALVAAFHSGLQAYRIGEERGALLAHARGGMHILEGDMARMVPVALPGCRCAADGFTFLVRSARPLAPPCWVTYQWQAGQLVRCEKPVSGVAVQNPQTTVLLGEACEVRFEYLWRGQWVAEHDAARDGIPEAVRVNGTVGAGPDALPLCTVFRLAMAAIRKDNSDDKDLREKTPRT